MMHGRWKSDSAVVAEKSVNKAELSAAELMDKGRGQGECKPANHVPGTEPGKRVTSVGTHTTSSKA
jgi:hypothetical protein